jgi:OmpA-OmpF porin, OOP family
MSAVPLLVVAALLLPAGVHPPYVDRDDVVEPSAERIERSVDTYSVDGSVERVAPPVETAAGTTLTIGSDVLFAYASSDLDPAAHEALEDQAEQVPDGAHVTVVGHTDARGGDAVNVPLSVARAEAVAAVLRAARPDLVLEVSGKGSSEPLGPETVGGKPDEQAMARNRRVELSWATG